MALSAGLQDTYEFAHAQIREAATLLLPAPAEEAIHRQIGRGLQSMTPAQREEHIFLLVRHLNQASTLPADWFERVELAGPQSSGRPPGAGPGGFWTTPTRSPPGDSHPRDDPPGDAWRDASILMRDLHLTAAQAASRGGQFEQSERLLGAIAERSTSALDHAAAAQVRMFGLFLQGQDAEAVVAAVHALRWLGACACPSTRVIDRCWRPWRARAWLCWGSGANARYAAADDRRAQHHGDGRLVASGPASRPAR
ncbi:MAG: hypothetical protein IPO81_28105 [Kouleothrix sp.]|nr:hypothetical protein [Kouleothrix sp.]